jgi:hypothetical protein
VKEDPLPPTARRLAAGPCRGPAEGSEHVDPADLLRAAANRLEALAARTTPGDWRTAALLATRPEVLAHSPDGGTEHVAEARAGSGAWIAALSPALAGPPGPLAAGRGSAGERRSGGRGFRPGAAGPAALSRGTPVGAATIPAPP